MVKMEIKPINIFQKTILFIFLWCISNSFASACLDNNASQAKATASLSLSIEAEPLKAIDECIRILIENEWMSNSKIIFWG